MVLVSEIMVRCPSPLRIQIIMFRCLVYESAVSGWVAAAPTNTDTRILDSTILHYARKLLRERATQETTRPDGSTAIRRITDKAVWRLIKCAPTAIEPTVRRLKWWRAIADNPMHPHLHHRNGVRLLRLRGATYAPPPGTPVRVPHPPDQSAVRSDDVVNVFVPPRGRKNGRG